MDEGGSLQVELAKKDAVIASIEDQVSTMSKAFQVRMEEADKKASQLSSELENSKAERNAEREDFSVRIDALKSELNEMRGRHESATILIRSLKAEQIQLERSVKDAERRASASDARCAEMSAKSDSLENELAWHEQEKARIARQAQKMSKLFIEMANGGGRGQNNGGGDADHVERSP